MAFCWWVLVASIAPQQLSAKSISTRTFCFRDQAKIPVSDTIAVTPKRWTASEKSQIIRLMNVANRQAPGLIKLAAAGQTIDLYRAAMIPCKLTGSAVDALSCPSGIVFCDTFFARSNQELIVFHELAHSADYCRSAYSLWWVRYMSVLILQGRNFPSLREGFADYVAENLFEGKSTFCNPLFNCNHYLLSPSAKDLIWAKARRRANLAMIRDEYEYASRLLEEANQIFPNIAVTHVELAHCYDRLHASVKCMHSLVRAIELFDSCEVPDSDEVKFQSLYRLTEIADEQKDLELAKNYLDRLIAVEPTNWMLRQKRVRCVVKLFHYSDSDTLRLIQAELKSYKQHLMQVDDWTPRVEPHHTRWSDCIDIVNIDAA